MQELIDYFRYYINVSIERTPPTAELRLQLLPIILEGTTGVQLRNPRQPSFVHRCHLSVSEDFTGSILQGRASIGIIDYIYKLGTCLYSHL
jgi:hypothetical protein